MTSATVPAGMVPASRPLRMARAMAIARHIYVRRFWVIVAAYAAAMAIPSAFDYVGFVNAFDTFADSRRYGAELSTAFSSAMNRIDPSGQDYLIWAFGAMFSALIYPFAVAVTILFLKSVIVNDGARFRDCLFPVLRNWLTYAQFGLVWFAGFTLCRNALFAMLDAIPDTNVSDLVAALLFVSLAAFLYGVQYVGYVAALVAITIDDVDPVRAAVAGLWLSARYSRGLFSIAWRSAAFIVSALLLIAVVYWRTKSGSIAVGIGIVGSLLFSSYLALGIALFFFDKLRRDGYAHTPLWLRLR
ncbi:MAG TPA: hypothetical protein VGD01_15615 [Candidatus Elarobacter sp.]|jgi:hypothetical protein